MINYIFLNQDSLIVFVNGKPYTINRNSNPNFQNIYDLLHKISLTAEDEQEIISLMDIEETINVFGDKKLFIKNSKMYYGDYQVSDTMTERILAMIKEKFPVEPLLKFLDNLLLNPSQESVKDLYLFLSKNSLPITDDGCFLAYKKVRGDYTDISTGTFNNSIGQIVNMPRDMVNPDRNQTCSSGLHVCSYDYLPHFARTEDNKVIIVKVNPMDVVSVPVDYENAKMRVCEYEVIGEINNYQETQLPDYYSPDSDYDDEGFDDEELDDNEELDDDEKQDEEDSETISIYVKKYISEKASTYVDENTNLNSIFTTLQKYNLLRHFCSKYNIDPIAIKGGTFIKVQDIIDWIRWTN